MPIVLLNESGSRVYEMTASQVVTKARYILQDETIPFRWSSLELISWINDAISTMVGIVPGLFTTTTQHTCNAGYRQTIVNSRAALFAEVVGVPAADHNTLTQFMPGWQASPAGPIQNWTRVESDPLSFYCYPPAVEGTALPVLIIERPLAVAELDDFIPLPENYEPALVDYVVAMAQAKDDESIDMNRMQLFQANFAARVKGA